MNVKSLARNIAGKLGTKDAILLLAAELLRHVDMSKVTAISQVLRGLTAMDNTERIAERVAARTMMAAPKLNKLIEEFEALQGKYSKFGAWDSEPTWFFENLMRKAVAGYDFPTVSPGDWQLFSSVRNWQRVEKTLTKKAKEIYEKLQNSPFIEVKELAKYHGWSI